MPNEVINRVHRVASQEHGNNGLLFEDRDHNPLVDPDDDVDDDSIYHPEEDDNSNGGDDDDDEDPGPPNDLYEGQPNHNHLPEDVGIDHNDHEPGPENNVVEDVGELPTHGQEEEHPTENEEEEMSNNQDEDQVAVNNDIGTPTIPNDPTLPPRVPQDSPTTGLDQLYTKDGHEAKHANNNTI